MSDFTKVFTFTIPAGNGSTATTAQSLQLPLCTVRRILIVFPPGCVNLVGIHINAGNSPAYPNDRNQFWSFDDYIHIQEVSNQITSGQWGVVGFNSDFNPHTIEIVFEADYVTFSPDLVALSPLAL